MLGPKLFTFYLNDFLQLPQTKTALFANDTAIYASFFNAQVALKQTQIHLDIIIKYFKKWHITLNAEKTECALFNKKFTNSQITATLKIHGKNIEPKNSIKYLGINLNKRLTFQTHFKETLNKAYGLNNTLYPLLAKNSGLSTKNKKIIYTTIIRPILTYAAPVWQSASDTAFLKLQRFQNNCLQLILNTDRYAKITDFPREAEIEFIQDYVRRLTHFTQLTLQQTH